MACSVRTFTLPHYPAYPVHLALFHHVHNADFLKSQLLAANPAFDYAFLDGSMILSLPHLLTAAFLTIHAFSSPSPTPSSPPKSRAKTRTPHSELVFRLSPNNNIAQSYQLFGLASHTTTLLVVKLGCRLAAAPARLDPGSEGGEPGEKRVLLLPDPDVTAASMAAHLGGVVEGVSVVMGEGGEELGAACQVERVRGVYKLGGKGGGAKKGGVVDKGDEAKERKELESIVLGIMSLKGS